MTVNKRKVLFVVNIPSPYRIDFFNELGRYCDLTVAFEGMTASDRDIKWKGAAAEKFHAVYLNGFRATSERFFCPNVIKLLKKDWNHIFLGGYSTLTLMLAIEYLRAKRKKFYIEVDGGMVSADSRIKFRIKRHFVSAAYGWMSTGKTTTDYLVHYGADRNRCIEYPFSSVRMNDVLFSEISEPLVYKKERDSLREKYKDLLGIRGTKVALAVGQIIPRKGYDILIKAMQHVRTDCQVIIVGGKPTKDLVNLINTFELKNVKFIEFLTKDELKEYYYAADVFIHPTREDIWGLVVNEAMAYGLPVITTDKCVAGEELIVNGHNGFLIEAENQNQLAETIEKFLKNDYKDIGFNAKQTSLSYTIEKMVEKHIEVIEE